MDGLEDEFPFGKAYVQGRTVSFREDIPMNHIKKVSPNKKTSFCFKPTNTVKILLQQSPPPTNRNNKLQVRWIEHVYIQFVKPVHVSHEKNPPTFHYTGWLIPGSLFHGLQNNPRSSSWMFSRCESGTMWSGATRFRSSPF